MNSIPNEDTIHQAAERGDLEALRRFIEVEGIGVDSKDHAGNTPLAIATLERRRESRTALVRYLTSKNADVEAIVVKGDGVPRYFVGCSVLMVASSRGHVEAVEMFLRGGANVNRRVTGRRQYTALQMATDNSKGLCAVPTLLKHGAAEAIPSESFDASLLNACRFQQASDIVRQLLENGAAVDSIVDGRCALHVAAASSDEATIRFLIEYGAAGVNHRTMIKLETPLMQAASNGNVSTLEALLEQDNVRIDLQSKEGCTALHLARSGKILGALLDHCRRTMTAGDFYSLLLQTNASGSIALDMRNTVNVEMAMLLVEQSRLEDGGLRPVCKEQLVLRLNRLSVDEQKRTEEPINEAIVRMSDAIFNGNGKVKEVDGYVKTFKSLVLAIPDGSGVQNRANDIAVKINPVLNDFQLSVVDEAFELIMSTMDLTDASAMAILGYLSPLDVMNRTNSTTASGSAKLATGASLWLFSNISRYLVDLFFRIMSWRPSY